MFGLSTIKMVVFGGAIVAVVTAVGLGYRSYTNLQVQVSTLKADNAVKEVALSIQNETIGAQANALGAWKLSQSLLVERVTQLKTEYETARKEVDRLNGIFSRHNLTELAKAKPQLIENRINAGSASIGRMLECATTNNGSGCTSPN